MGLRSGAGWGEEGYLRVSTPQDSRKAKGMKMQVLGKVCMN